VKKIYEKVIQRNLSKQNIIGTNFCD